MMYKLPLEAYTSESWFKNEQEKIFSNTWQFVGFIEDFKETGDHKCVNFGDLHLMVVLGEDKKLSALHTACCHRGNRLKEVQGNKIICPYHRWAYDLKGQLIAAPESRELHEFNKEDIHLVRGSVVRWKTLVFAHPKEDAPDFYEHVSELENFMGPHKPELLEEYHDENNVYLAHCNWKLFCENYMDGYHLPYLHSETLYMYDHSKQVSRYAGDHWAFYEPLTKDYENNIGKYGYEAIDHIPKEKLGAYVHLLFPNLGITESESTWTVLQILPLEVNKTLLIFRSKVMPSYKNKSWFKKKEKKPIEVSDFNEPLKSYDFMIEDMYVCEQIQKNMENKTFTTGPLHETKEASFEGFHDVILQYMNHAR
ncbi:aromatic ring-hydroxylating dioxygenase subunit alpha [Acidaminobacter sp. JC074]|uniref:aromatic ring-hydroxylating oxygenase subunit alpha n=1 Tax=Acidaminobacter sp. JC074 TaxID=2530199 RepID=UPI001F0D5F5F|nr:aromatic ring-hydroxylating dioxygenase subunit alpha [Acidaminobacter sp. JC074]MCH4887089.1 aromatic ring-hydroxylating dioxygenase subunit alpha [Acidaminobacter sp. JC074]